MLWSQHTRDPTNCTIDLFGYSGFSRAETIYKTHNRCTEQSVVWLMHFNDNQHWWRNIRSRRSRERRVAFKNHVYTHYGEKNIETQCTLPADVIRCNSGFFFFLRWCLCARKTPAIGFVDFVLLLWVARAKYVRFLAARSRSRPPIQQSAHSYWHDWRRLYDPWVLPPHVRDIYDAVANRSRAPCTALIRREKSTAVRRQL